MRESMSNIEYANTIIAFLQNIDNTPDARIFVRIALDAIENMAEHTNQFFNRKPIQHLICMIDNRIQEIE